MTNAINALIQSKILTYDVDMDAIYPTNISDLLVIFVGDIPTVINSIEDSDDGYMGLDPLDNAYNLADYQLHVYSANATAATNQTFTIDWTLISGDWLAMDGNGSWYSYFREPSYDEDEGWCINDLDNDIASAHNGGPFCKLNITYRHPDPATALYPRPGLQ